MNLVIHDLEPAAWETRRAEYDGWEVISDNGTIRPCTGCFCCWHKTPGQCVIRDGYDNMGALIHNAAEVTVISRYTYGGFSSFVKNVFDRSLGFVLPQFEIVSGETHHKKRYEEDKPFNFIFHGPPLSPEEKQSAQRYVQAVCTNIRGSVKKLVFLETEERPAAPYRALSGAGGKVFLLNASERFVSGNSAKLAEKLVSRLEKESEITALHNYSARIPELFPLLDTASDLVLCMPLYVDGLPSQLIRFMEQARKEYRGSSIRVYALANMGLYESRQLQNLFEAVRQWCDAMQFTYCGGLGVSAGEFVGVIMDALSFEKGPTRPVASGIHRLAAAIDKGEPLEDIYAEPRFIPRPLFMAIANHSWTLQAKKNGIPRSELFRRL